MRRAAGRDVACVVIDSVQSQARRLGQALGASGVPLPQVVVDFATAGRADVGTLTSLSVPHRVYDAILRDSLLGDTPWMTTTLGRRLREASPHNALAVWEVDPTSLLFGCWYSTGIDNPVMSARFARAITSEITGVEVQLSARAATRIDPLQIPRDREVFIAGQDWSDEPPENGAAAVRPSEINHGNIVSYRRDRGVTVDYGELCQLISLAGLRHLRVGTEAFQHEAARAVVAAIGLLAIRALDADGYDL